MIEALLVVLGAVAAGIPSYLYARSLERAATTERVRTHELLTLLEAKEAPQEFYAALGDTDPGPAGVWIHDDSGLVANFFPEDSS